MKEATNDQKNTSPSLSPLPSPRSLLGLLAYNLLLFLPVGLGCGGQAHFEADQPPPHIDRVGKMLDGMAETGDRSALPYLKQEVIALKAEGDPHATALLADIAQLEKTSQPAQFKALASQARGRLAAGK